MDIRFSQHHLLQVFTFLKMVEMKEELRYSATEIQDSESIASEGLSYVPLYTVCSHSALQWQK